MNTGALSNTKEDVFSEDMRRTFIIRGIYEEISDRVVHSNLYADWGDKKRHCLAQENSPYLPKEAFGLEECSEKELLLENIKNFKDILGIMKKELLEIGDESFLRVVDSSIVWLDNEEVSLSKELEAEIIGTKAVDEIYECEER